MSSLNPWQRLAARVPSVFATDTYFTAKRPAKPSRGAELDMGVMSKAGERHYLLRQAARRRSVVPCK